MDKLKDFFLSFVIPFVVTLAVLLGIWHFVGAPVSISGASMAPTLLNGEQVWLNRLDHDYQRGKIIIFDAPDGSGDEYVKRIIGLPGDTVEYHDNDLYVNGELVEEPYLDTLKAENPGLRITPIDSLASLESTQTERVPEGKLFVLGDNRPISKDSEEFGFIEQSHVQGTVGWRLWPLNRLGEVKPVEPNELTLALR